ncbi:MAG TPA: type II toxin-antitoxin system Phd/YefM family antitoxin [Tepidiformaceae bacterium]|jgi:prevent-host-death family protein|nr:type II toxin-antitoxin system Phd/YefM family antitoxin [Tepidiformaceae bacterium]
MEFSLIARSRTWQLQEAKNKFSELVRRAREEGPQVVTVRGEEVAVVVDANTFLRLEDGMSQGDAILRFMDQWASENADIELELPARTVDLSPPVKLDDGP